MKKKYIVTLTEEERSQLRAMIRKGKGSAGKLRRARILLKADAGPSGPGWIDARISEALDVGHATVERLRQRFVEEGFEACLEPRRRRRVYERKLDGDGEAHLIALACGEAPEGQSRWSLRLLADALVEQEVVDSISHECVRQALKKTN